MVIIVFFSTQNVVAEEDPHEWTVSTIDWKPDGSYALIGGTGGLIAIYNEKSIEVESNIQFEAINQIAWDPKGETAIIAGNGGIYLFKDTLSSLKLDSEVNYRCVDWNPLGNLALIGGHIQNENGGYSASLLKYDGNDLTDITEVINDVSNISISKIAWNPKSDFALIYCDNGKLYEYKEEKITPITELNEIFDLAWKPDGSKLYILFDDLSIGSWDGHKPFKVNVLTKGKGSSNWLGGILSWKHDGSFALVAGHDALNNQWKIYKYEGAMKFVLELTNRQITDIAWHPSGDYALVVGSYEDSGGMLQKIVIPNENPEVVINPTVVAVSLITFTTFMYFGLTETGRYTAFEFLFLPLFSKIKKKHPLENKMRELIYEYIELKPGENYSSIKKTLGLANGTLVYHLKILKKENLIRSVSNGRYKRFYPFESDELDKSMIYDHDGPQMLTDLQKKIIEKIEEQPEISQIEVARSLGVSKQVVSYHIIKLAKAGVLDPKRKIKSRTYA